MTTLSLHSPARRTALLLGILLIAANLRVPITALPPLLGPIRDSFSLGTAAAGALTTLPLLIFALVSPLSAPLARRWGLERTLFAALAMIALGIGIRSLGMQWALYLGTAAIGAGIAVGNVLLPSLVKRDFAHHVTTLTGAYALSMGLAAALGSAVVIPLAHAQGWQGALAWLAVLPVAALALWSTQLGAHSSPVAASTATGPATPVWRSALAWQITLFLGLNSTIYYVAIGWLPTILTDAALSPQSAGSLHGVMQLATAVPGLLLGPLLRNLRDQRVPAAASAGLSVVALLGLWGLPQLAVVWCALFGMGTGAGMILGLSFIGLRTRNAPQAAALSGLSQCVGYLLAATGPMLMGSLHDTAGSWGLPLALCAALAGLAVWMGCLAGRNRQIAL